MRDQLPQLTVMHSTDQPAAAAALTHESHSWMLLLCDVKLPKHCSVTIKNVCIWGKRGRLLFQAAILAPVFTASKEIHATDEHIPT